MRHRHKFSRDIITQINFLQQINDDFLNGKASVVEFTYGIGILDESHENFPCDFSIVIEDNINLVIELPSYTIEEQVRKYIDPKYIYDIRNPKTLSKGFIEALFDIMSVHLPYIKGKKM